LVTPGTTTDTLWLAPMSMGTAKVMTLWAWFKLALLESATSLAPL
jgi:hypothetical protein